MRIESGIGNGRFAGVNAGNRLLVSSVTEPKQHDKSKTEELSFRTFGTASLATGTIIPMLIQNNNESLLVVITHVHMQVIAGGASSLPSVNNYFQMGFNQTFSSGGAFASITNSNAGSSISSNVVAYQSTPTVSGSFSPFNRLYPEEAIYYTMDTNSSLIVPPTRTFETQFVTDNDTGIAYVSVDFYLEEVDEN